MSIQTINLMTKNLITAHVDMTLQEASLLMKSRNIRHLPVVDESDGIVGIFSSKDFPMVGDQSKMTLEFFMSTPAIYVSENSSLKETIHIMIDKKISSVLVADNEEIAVGIITTEDILRYLLKNLENEPVHAKSYLHKLLDMQTLGQMAQQASNAGI